MTSPGPDTKEKHDHAGPWWAIGVALVALILATYAQLAVTQHQFNVIYDRVGEIRREMECERGEILVTDHEGDEYCLEAERENDK